MPLPVVGQTMELVFPQSLRKALVNHAPVTGGNANYSARMGNATWLGNKLVFAGEGLGNYWYLPDVQDEVSVCVVHPNGYGEAYVLSQNYGGCEYHALYHAATKHVALLHVYKGSGGLATYTIGSGWTLRSRIHSKGLMLRFGGGTVWSISCIDRSTDPPTVRSKFISAKGVLPPRADDPTRGTLGNTTSNPLVTITHEDDGTNPT